MATTPNLHERLIAEVIELLKNAEYQDGTAIVLTQDCEAIEAVLDELQAEAGVTYLPSGKPVYRTT
jgi:hypothetical protein